MDDVVARWRAAALASEGPILVGRARAALAAAPSAAAVRDLSLGAFLLERDGILPDAQRRRGLELVRWGLAKDKGDLVRWDAAHAAGELAWSALEPDLRAIMARPGESAPAVRARAAEAYAHCSSPQDARAVLDAARQQDPDWTVRRLAGDALRLLTARRLERGELFGRFRALVRCGLARVDGGSAPLTPRQVAELGLRLSPAHRLFLATASAGGRIVIMTAEADGKLAPGPSVTLTAPAALRAELEAAAGPARTDERRRVHDAVWSRYVDGEKVSLDEDEALRVLGARYDRGLVDADLWNYGVLLYEAAFRDDARRTALLRRAVASLEAFREAVPEAWDVVDDRLEEARDLVLEADGRARAEEDEAEGDAAPRADAPAAAPDPSTLVTIGVWEGITPLAVALEQPGLFALDPDRRRPPARLAASLALFLDDPLGHAPGAAGEGPAAVEPRGSLALLDEAAAHLTAGRLRQAGRLLGDAIEQDGSDPTLDRAGALLSRDGLTPLLAAQLLATIPMAGDRKSMDVVRTALQAVTPDRARDMVEALGPLDEDGSPYALLVDAAAGLRKKTHTEARDVAKRLKTSRSKQHQRSTRNPFYKS